MKNIAIAFASPVNLKSIQKPNQYQIFGENYDCIQTNESALLYLQRQVQRKYHQSLDFIFLIVSGTVENGLIPTNDIFAPCRHVDFLKARLKSHFSRGAGAGFPLPVIRCEPYDENASPEECNIAIARIADKVEEAVRQTSADKKDEVVRLHADMTGGYRNASMLLLSMMELLKYKGMEIGDVMYSDPAKADPAVRVAPVTEIMRMFTLINGVDEFVKNGSVETIQEYFRTEPGEKSPELEALLVGMQQFSDAICLCRTDNIKDSMCQLDRLIRQFDDVQGKRLPEQLFAKILDRVANEYRQVTNPTATDINIIEWCLEKGFVQQALTLCTERLPIYFVQRGIFYPADEAKAKKEAAKDKLHRHWEQNFFLHAHPAVGAVHAAHAADEAARIYEAFVEALRAQAVFTDQLLAELGVPAGTFQGLLADIGRADILIDEMRQEMVSEVGERGGCRYPGVFFKREGRFSRLLRFIYYLRNDLQDYQDFLFHSVSRQCIIGTLDSKRGADYAVPDSFLVLIRSLAEHKKAKSRQKQQRESENKQETMTEKLQRREKTLQACFATGAVNTRCKDHEEEVIRLLKQAERLRHIRNQINHAADEETAAIGESELTSGAVKKEIYACLEQLHALERQIV